jgi:hypothetical protein
MNRDSYRHIRSAVFEKRPLSTDILDGEIAVNYHTDSVGVFIRDTLGYVRKIGPAYVSSTQPSPVNYTDLSNGELWIDTSEVSPAIRYWDASSTSWISTGILDSPLDENNIIVGTTSGVAKSYELNANSFFVDQTVGSLEVRLADSIEFGSFKFISETGVGLRTSVFKTLINAGETGWVELEAYDKSEHKSGKYLVEIYTSTDEVSVTELLVSHNAADTYMTEYGTVGSTQDPLGEFQAITTNVGGTDMISLQFRRTAGVTGSITLRSSQISLF